MVRFTPLLQNVLKFFALVLMVFDHANRALGLHEPVLLLGRGHFRCLRCCGGRMAPQTAVTVLPVFWCS